MSKSGDKSSKTTASKHWLSIFSSRSIEMYVHQWDWSKTLYFISVLFILLLIAVGLETSNCAAATNSCTHCHHKCTQLLLEPAAVLEYSDKISFKDSYCFSATTDAHTQTSPSVWKSKGCKNIRASTFDAACRRLFKPGQAVSLLIHFLWSLDKARPTVMGSRPLTTLWKPLSRVRSSTYMVDLHSSLYPSPMSTLELKRNKIMSPSQRNLSPTLL